MELHETQDKETSIYANLWSSNAHNNYTLRDVTFSVLSFSLFFVVSRAKVHAFEVDHPFR